MWGRHARRIAQRMHVGQRTSPPPPAPPSRGMGCSHGLSPMWPAVLGAVAVDAPPGRTTQATRRRAMLAMDANQRTLLGVLYPHLGFV